MSKLGATKMSIALRKCKKTKHVVIGQHDKKLSISTSLKLTPENSKREALTNQAFKKTCDINAILSRFRKTGVLDHVSKYEPQYGELSNIDIETAFNNIKEAEEIFGRLPKNIQDNFHNKAENFFAYMEYEENRSTEALLQTSASRDGSANSENEGKKPKDSSGKTSESKPDKT